MLPAITTYCIIRDQTIVRNGKILFDGSGNRLMNFLELAYNVLKLDYPKFYKMDPLSKLGFLAAEVLLTDRPVTREYPAEAIAVVLSNANASMDTDIRYAESARTVGSPALFVYTLPNIVAGEICIRHKIKGENAFFVTPSFNAELLTNYVDLILSSPSPNACLAGWIDVLGEHHDVFLYLVEKNKDTSPQHTADQLKELYQSESWNN